MEIIRKNSIIESLIILLIISQISQASILFTRYLPFTIGLILVFIDFLNSKRTYSRKFFLLVVAWILINILSIVLNEVQLFIPRLAINTMNLLFLPYLLIRRMGMAFWIKFEKIIFLLTVLSLPLYFLSLFFSNFFNNLEAVFSHLTYPTFLQSEIPYWSAIFYTHVYYIDDIYKFGRNCGFMWEPGSFSMIIVWAIMYNWLYYDKKHFDKRIIIYLIALATTFSTGGYIAFAFLMAGRFIKRITIFNSMLLIVALVFFYFAFSRLEFVSYKIDNYIEVYKDDPTGQAGNPGSKVNRLQGGVTAFKRTLDFPTGYGLVSAHDREDKYYFYGTNGLASLLEMWGFFLFPVILILIYQSLKIFGRNIANKTMLFFYFLALMAVFFSNPVARNLFTYFLIATPLAICPVLNKTRNLLTSN